MEVVKVIALASAFVGVMFSLAVLMGRFCAFARNFEPEEGGSSASQG